MSHIIPVDNHYAIIFEGRVVGAVCKMTDTQWCTIALEGSISGGGDFIPIRYALQAAKTWKPDR